MAHAQPAADRDVVARQFSAFDDGDKPEVLAEDIDVVGRRHGKSGFEFPRQIGRPVQGFVLAAGHEFLVEIDLVIGAGFRQGKFAPGAGVIIDLLDDGVALRVGRGHDVAVDVAAGGDGVEQGLMHALDEFFDVALEHTVKLKRLPRGQTQ